MFSTTKLKKINKIKFIYQFKVSFNKEVILHYQMMQYHLYIFSGSISIVANDEDFIMCTIIMIRTYQAISQ